MMLIELLRPMFEQPRDVPAPIGKLFAVLFVVLNLGALATLRPRRGLLVLAALNAVLSVTTVVMGALSLFTGGVPSGEIDTSIAIAYFTGLAPLIAAAYFFGAARENLQTPN
ncbi:MAG: hypothetical protein JSR73_19325 [Proteobacteria bacterium]|nr:hypothetical protein [Pseudomonadota bacterium]